ncbi:hypothetical protein B0D78_01990 [Pyramidobacter sp. C12-8]|nr:hypothetical protein B0D78_01990 [Pyramidobacter sp. C12-8]
MKSPRNESLHGVFRGQLVKFCWEDRRCDRFRSGKFFRSGFLAFALPKECGGGLATFRWEAAHLRESGVLFAPLWTERHLALMDELSACLGVDRQVLGNIFAPGGTVAKWRLFGFVEVEEGEFLAGAGRGSLRHGIRIRRFVPRREGRLANGQYGEH